jgi:hypothetical protein
MKLLRALYMILATIILFPFIVLFSIIWFGVIAYASFLLGEPKKALGVWLNYLKAGIDMNIDFIKNGL